MSDTLTAPGGMPTLDISDTQRVPLLRLVGVELRKLVDTRAGKWLMIIMGLLTALVMVIQLWIGAATDLALNYGHFIAGTAYSIGFLLPILAIMSVTSEWGQRTAMVTFTLEPHRLKVVLAKVVAALLVAIVSVVFAILLGAVANSIYGAIADGASWNVSAKDLVAFFLGQMLALVSGFALGAAFLNTAGAIVVYFALGFVVTPLLQLGAALLDWFEPIAKWLDFAMAQLIIDPTSGSALEGTGEEWAQLIVTTLIWVGIPLVIGIGRILRSEAK